jgi:signal transduction histidine kinase
MQRPRRSLSLPIVLASVAVALSITLLVFWLLIAVREYELGPEVSTNTWLIVLGSVAFAFIMVVLVLFSVFLVAESREVQRQDRFIDSVTHELKSPLTGIRLGLETLGRAGIDADNRESLRQMMLADVARLTSFIEGVIEAARLAHERGGHDLKDHALAPLCSDVVGRVVARHRIPADEITVEVDAALVFRTDRSALETIVANLVDNAVKYSDAPRRVAVAVRADGDDIVLVSVRDEGIGIPRSELSRVPLRFHRVQGEEVRRRRGTGLGLYVVATLVEELGGKLRVESAGPGAGTQVSVRLPGRISTALANAGCAADVAEAADAKEPADAA